MSLSYDQLRAIRHFRGPALVLAGPGSGKTTVITQRILYLMETGIPPENILVITFTKAAASEMEQRFRKMLAADKRAEDGSVAFGTFHSVFFSMLCHQYHLSQQNIVTDYDRLQILRELVGNERIDASYDADFFRLLTGEISRYKADISKEFTSHILDTGQFLRIAAGYERMLQERRLLDFDDMLLRCYRLFKESPAVLRTWQEHYPFILVDEFQDINRIQYEIVRMLAQPQGNLFAVGDDDQSIYRFRGAHPEIMLGFARDYPEAKQILLSQNYRSREEIVLFAGNLISCNRQRFDKDIRAVKGGGGRVLLHTTEDAVKEYGLLTGILAGEIARGRDPDSIAVLYRANAMIRPLIAELIRCRIPFTVKDHVQNIYEHFIAKDLIAYISIAAGRGNRADLIRIMNKPLRYLSRDALRGRNASFEMLLQYYRGRQAMCRSIEALRADLLFIKTLPTAAALVYIRRKTGYEAFLRDYARQNHAEMEPFCDIMDEIEAAAASHPDKEEWLRYIEAYGERLQEESRKGRDEHGVHLMTYHSSKGLEFDIVHLTDVCEGVTPFKKAVSREEIEEERRAFYVAATRAKEEIHMYVTRTRYSKKISPSRFIKEGAGR